MVWQLSVRQGGGRLNAVRTGFSDVATRQRTRPSNKTTGPPLQTNSYTCITLPRASLNSLTAASVPERCRPKFCIGSQIRNA